MGTTTIVSGRTSHGKELKGFMIMWKKKRWRERYNTTSVEELFDILTMVAQYYCPERAYFVAYT